jgi:hypothetical protein
MIGSTACHSINYLNATTITCLTPAAETAGAVDVTLDTPTQEPSILAGGYQYYLPFSISQISPDWGMATGGATVTITGTNLTAGLAVTLGAVPCLDVIVTPDGTSLTCTTGEYQLAAGLTEAVVNVSVTDGVLTTGLPAAYEYLGEIYLRLQTSSEKVSFHLSPSVAGAVTSTDHQVTVATNSHAGYQLSLSSSTAQTDLIGTVTSATLAPSPGTPLAPLKLTPNTWGFAWTNSPAALTAGFANSGFDVAYQAEENHSGSSSRWAGLPAVSSPTTVRSTSWQSKAGEQTALFYAANVDFTLPLDTYSRTILYTVIEN